MDVNLDGDTTDTVYLISNLNELLWIQEQIENNPSENWSKRKTLRLGGRIKYFTFN